MKYDLCEFNDGKTKCSHNDKKFYAVNSNVRSLGIKSIVDTMESMFLTTQEIDSAIVSYAVEKLSLS